MLSTENKSYVLRRGRITAAQLRALQTLRARYEILPRRNPDWSAIFGRDAPLALEIGGGYGEAAAQLARSIPEHNYVVLEVHEAGIGALMNHLAAADLHNVRVVRADAAAAVPLLFTAHALHCVRLFFPDPWPKKRHHKRRLLNADFVALLAKKIVGGGFVHAATDWADYATQMRDCFLANPDFVAGGENVSRPQTRFAVRAAAENRAISDLVYVRRGGVPIIAARQSCEVGD